MRTKRNKQTVYMNVCKDNLEEAYEQMAEISKEMAEDSLEEDVTGLFEYEKELEK